MSAPGGTDSYTLLLPPPLSLWSLLFLLLLLGGVEAGLGMEGENGEGLELSHRGDRPPKAVFGPNTRHRGDRPSKAVLGPTRGTGAIALKTTISWQWKCVMIRA